MAHRLGPKAPTSYALEGSVAVAGLGVSWLRDNLRIIHSAQESEDVAASVSPPCTPLPSAFGAVLLC